MPKSDPPPSNGQRRPLSNHPPAANITSAAEAALVKAPSAAATIPATQVSVMPQTAPSAAQLPLPGFAFGLSVTNADAEMEIVRRITPEHISQELANSHERALRMLELHEKAIIDEAKERDREHERDMRDRLEQKGSDGRLERLFYVIFGAVVILVAVLVAKGKEELALKMIGAITGILVTVLGGMGVEKLRRDRADRRQKRKPSDAKDTQDPDP